MRITHVVSPILAAALAACTPSSGHEARGPGAGRPPPEVSVVIVTPHPVPVSFEYVGQTAGSREVEVRARVTGILLSHNFKEGAAVKAGQSLFTHRPRAVQGGAGARRGRPRRRAGAPRAGAARRRAAQAAVRRERGEPEASTTTRSRPRRSRRPTPRRRARGCDEARAEPRLHRVAAPISGVAGRALQSDGSLVSGPDVLLTRVVQVDPIWVNFGIPDSRPGAAAQRGRLGTHDAAQERRHGGRAAAGRRHELPARRAGRLSPTCASRPRPARRRRAPSCPTRTARCARDSSCA